MILDCFDSTFIWALYCQSHAEVDDTVCSYISILCWKYHKDTCSIPSFSYIEGSCRWYLWRHSWLTGTKKSCITCSWSQSMVFCNSGMSFEVPFIELLCYSHNLSNRRGICRIKNEYYSGCSGEVRESWIVILWEWHHNRDMGHTSSAFCNGYSESYFRFIASSDDIQFICSWDNL